MSQRRIAELEKILSSYIEKYGQTEQARRYFISMTTTKRLKVWRFPPIWEKRESAKKREPVHWGKLHWARWRLICPGHPIMPVFSEWLIYYSKRKIHERAKNWLGRKNLT